MTTVTAALRAPVDARLAALPADIMVDIYEAPHLEREKSQFSEYLQVDLAHTVMLAEQGVLRHDDAKAIVNTLQEIVALGVGRFQFDPRKGSFLFQIESYLFDRIGERVGGRMHTGRSRLDQGPTVRRLYKRKRLLHVFEGLIGLQNVLLEQAAKHRDTVMPGYTCLQHAHPSVFGHYLLAFSARLSDDFERLKGAYQRLNLNPLGAAGLAGTAWSVDRERTTTLLGFDGILENSKLAREAWYAADVASGLSFVMGTLNSLATDLHLWSSYEFGYVETADEFCGTSSIFPQKKNPAGLEAIKFAAGGSTTWLASALATFRAEGTGDVMMHEVPLLDDAFKATTSSLQLIAAILDSLCVNKERMATAANANWSTATNLADLIVHSSDWSFREAHSVVARLVRTCIENGISSREVGMDHLNEACTQLNMPHLKLSSDEIRASLDAARFADSRTSLGGTSQPEIARLLLHAERTVQAETEWLKSCNVRIANAELTLESALQSLMKD